MLAELVATLSAALFAGAAVYINAVEHPARMSLGPAAALAEWRPAYRRGTRMQAPLAVVGCLTAVAAWATGAGRAWLIGGLLLGAVVPVTLVVIFPTNAQLLAPTAADDPGRAAALLGRWNRLHAVRTLLSLAALVLFLTQLS
jgi:uncharacterized membrane protein